MPHTTPPSAVGPQPPPLHVAAPHTPVQPYHAVLEEVGFIIHGGRGEGVYDLSLLVSHDILELDSDNEEGATHRPST